MSDSVQTSLTCATSPDPAEPPAVPESVRVRNIAFTLVSVAIVILLLQLMRPVFLPLVLGALLFYALDPAVDRLQKWRVPRALGAALMLFLFISASGGAIYALQGQAMTVIDQLPSAARKMSGYLRRVPGGEPGTVEKVQQAADALQSAKDNAAPPGVTRVQVEEPVFEASTFVWSTSVGIVSTVSQLIMVLFLTYFMLLSDQLFKRKLVEIVGTFSQKKVTVAVLEDIATQIEQFLLIQLMTSGVVAVATGLALWAMGLQQAALWGLLAGVFNSIPYYGPLLVTGGLALLGFLQFGTPSMTIAVAGVALLITTLEGMLLTPMLMSRASSMNQVAIFTGLLFWSWVWGMWGLLLAVPMMMVIKVVCDRVEPLQPVGHLLGD
ncbi:MAG: AI-2E family transporter [Acidobacteria bacterium]|nr:AI-2E family transporter [Acidobacteriota bacterium]